MPTQEEINAANVELQIANDNYAALANRYNNYMSAFQSYANASPEVKQKLEGTMQKALSDFENLKLNMYAAEDRIAQAQNRVNNLATVQPVVTPAWWTRRRVVNPQPVVEQVVEEVVATPTNSFWWAGWSNNDWTLISPDWATKVYPNGSIEFNWVAETVPQDYYSRYAQMKWSGTPSIQIADWFRENLWKANSHTASLVRNDLASRWFTTQQINDFVQDWGNATLAPRNVQYNLASPQRIRTWGTENAPQIRTWWTVNPNDPRLLTNR